LVKRILEQEKTKALLEEEKKNPLFWQPLAGLGDDPFLSKANPSYRPARWELIMTTMQQSVEANYFWILDNLAKSGHYGFGCKVEKIRDVYAAGAASSFWGSVEQRKAIQQEKAMNYMATIGKMLKDIFQVIRELRVMDERLEYYILSDVDWYKKNQNEKIKKFWENYLKRKNGNTTNKEKIEKLKPEDILAAEIALKGTWIDIVEGGAKNPASVYGLSREVGFVTLPDLFFRLSPKNTTEINKALKQAQDLGINKKVQEVLSRKLFQYLVWKEKTQSEIQTRRDFILKYLRQHYNVIKTYMNWLKPYLENIKQLQMQGMEGPELAHAFDTSKIELELIGIKEGFNISTPEGYEESHKFKKYFPALRVKINFVAMPHMAYQNESQRGAIHLGKAEIDFEAYVVTKDQIKKYKEILDEEDMKLVASYTGAMEALGQEFFDYLKEAGEEMEEEKPKEEKKSSTIKEMTEPFTSIFSGFKDVLGFKKEKLPEGEIKLSSSEEKAEKKAAAKIAITIGGKMYEVFKKAHGQMTPK